MIKNGDVFERLTVINTFLVPSCTPGKRKTKCLCLCNCGSEPKEIDASNLIKGSTLSCGCYSKELFINNVTTHGLSRHPLYAIWRAMLNRCYLKNCKFYKIYGERGIQVCQDWRFNFTNYYDWVISQNWIKGLTIDRIDNDGNYTPCNCRLYTNLQQQNNRSDNRRLIAFGEMKTIAEWSRDSRCKVNDKVFRNRVTRQKIEIEEAMTKPLRRNKNAN